MFNTFVTRRLPCIATLSATVVMAGCGRTDLSQTPKYANVIGAQYRTKVELYALGVYPTNDSKEVTIITVAPVQDTGSEVAFRRTVPHRQILQVVAVRKRFMPFDNGLEFVVKIDGLDLPVGVDIVVPLYGDMQSDDGFLDQRYFERVPAQ